MTRLTRKDFEDAMRLVRDAPRRVQHWPHHPKCAEPLGGDHIVCPIDPTPSSKKVGPEELRAYIAQREGGVGE